MVAASVVVVLATVVLAALVELVLHRRRVRAAILPVRVASSRPSAVRRDDRPA